MNPRTLMAVGVGICLAAAALMIADVLSVGWGSALGVIGLGVIGSAAKGR